MKIIIYNQIFVTYFIIHLLFWYWIKLSSEVDDEASNRINLLFLTREGQDLQIWNPTITLCVIGR